MRAKLAKASLFQTHLDRAQLFHANLTGANLVFAQLTDALKHLLRNRPIYGYRFEGTRYDAGDKLGFLKATVEYALRRHDLGGPFREYLKGLKL